MFRRSGRAIWLILPVFAFVGCRDKKGKPAGGSGKGPGQSASADGDGAVSGRPGRARPKGRVGRLVARIDALNPKLRKAIETLDRMSAGAKGLKPPAPGKLAEELLSLAKAFPDSSDRLWAYYEKAAAFLDHYARLVKNLPKLEERELEILEKRFNAKAVAHNSARLGIKLLVAAPGPSDPRGLDPLSFGHKVSKLGRSVSKRLTGWYRRNGGKLDRGPRPTSGRAIGFRVGTLRRTSGCGRALKQIEGISCRGRKRICTSLRKRVADFATGVRTCLDLWDRLSVAVHSGKARGEIRKLADRLRRAHHKMVELRVALPSGKR